MLNSSDELVCRACGLVISPVHYVPPLIPFKAEPRNSPRVLQHGAIIPTPYGSTCSTTSVGSLYDAKSKPLDTVKRLIFSRLSRLHRLHSFSKSTATSLRALYTLRRVCSLLGVSEATYTHASYLVMKMLRSGMKADLTSYAIVGACIIIASRRFDPLKPVTVRSVTRLMRQLGHKSVSKNSVLRSLFLIRRLTGIIQVARPENYLSFICSKVAGLSSVRAELKLIGVKPEEYMQRLLSVSKLVLSRIPPTRRGGRDPFVLSASAVYAADRLLAVKANRAPLLTQSLLGQQLGIAVYTLRDHFTMLVKPVLHQMGKE